MKVSEYRDLIDSVYYWLRSLQSAATSYEQRTEAMHVRTAADRLREAKCRTAKHQDVERAKIALMVADRAIAAKQEQFDAADVALCRMAFGSDYR